MRPSPELSVVDLDTARLPGRRVRLAVERPLTLDCGVELSPITVAYQTYGELNPARSNAILVCHALTGDQFAAEPHPITGKDGWWDLMIGPGQEGLLGPEGLQRVETLPVFTAGLLSRGYSEEDVARILGGNALRVLADLLPAGPGR